MELLGPLVAQMLAAIRWCVRRVAQKLASRRSAARAVAKTVRRYRQHVDAVAPAHGLALRNHATAIHSLLLHGDKPVVLVHGIAGCGKSTVASELLSLWSESGHRAAAARLDIDRDFRTSEMLGESMGLEESPVSSLARTGGNDPALLLIDQMDAVSTFSGRTPDNYEAVDDVLEELKDHTAVKAVLIVRTADLNNDPRLSSLMQDEERIASYEIGDLWPEQVKRCLQANGALVPDSSIVLELLRRPVNLRVFIDLSRGAQDQEYRTLKDLYDRYTEESRDRLERAAPNDFDWHSAVNPIVGYMSDNQTLSMPSSLARSKVKRVALVKSLFSEGILIQSGDQFRFFHESYFDFLFASSFVANGERMCQFLLDNGQHLFRRAQVRQVLQYLQESDVSQFYKSVIDLVSHSDIRSHIKHLVTSLLADVLPEHADWSNLQPFAWNDNWLSEDVRWLLTRPQWFDSADDLLLWDQWLRDTEKVDAVFGQLVQVAEQRGPRVGALVNQCATTELPWQQRIAVLIDRSLNADWSTDAIRLLRSRRADNVLSSNHPGMGIWWRLKSLADEDSAAAAAVIGAMLKRAETLAQGSDPFASGHFAEHSHFANYIVEIAKENPLAFAQHVLPFVIRIAPLGQRPHSDSIRFPQGQRWGYRWIDTAHDVDDHLFDAVDASLRHIAESDYEACLELVAALMAEENAELRFLAARALTAGDDADVAIAWLVSDERNMSLGWASGHNVASQDLIRRHSPDCSDELFQVLENLLMHYVKPWERNADTRRWREHDQFSLLSAVARDRLSQSAQRRLQELERKFEGVPPTEATPVEAYTVRSPIDDDNAEHMSDDNWLSAMRKYCDLRSYSRHDGDPSKGGAEQLANQLRDHAKSDPKRFARVAMRFDEQILAVCMRAVIESVAPELDAGDLAKLCQLARRLYGQDVGQAIANAVQEAQAINDDIVDLLIDVAQDDDPSEEIADNGFFGGDYLTAGLNCTRGQAAIAAAQILAKHRCCTDDLKSAVSHLADDDTLAVRHWAVTAVHALGEHDEALALDLAEHLFRKDIRVLSDRQRAQRLLRWALDKVPQRFSALLSLGLQQDSEVGQETGKTWAILRYHDALPHGVPTEAAGLDASARLGAAKVYAESVAECLDDLFGLLDDDNEEIRRAVAHSVWKLGTLSTDEVGQLLRSLLHSKSHAEAIHDLIHCLAGYKYLYPDNTLEAIELVLDISGSDIGDIRTAAAIIATDLWTLLLRIYRQGNHETRERCLDMIDKLIEHRIHRGENNLDDEDRIGE